jgi:hypothetical protein
MTVVLRGDIRAGDADRDAAAIRLREHFAAGRLPLAEFQQRLDAAYRAQTVGDLVAATGDLPGSGPALGAAGQAYRRAHAYRSAVRGQYARGWARAGRRLLLALGVLAAGAGTAVLLATFYLFHGGLLAAALLVLLVLVAAGAAALAGLAWITVRVWRRGAWLEALPLLAGQPWLSRVVWAARLLWTGRTLWRLRGRLRLAPRA